MTWILFVWLYAPHPVAISSQEFNTREACVKAARSLKANLNMGFVCVEKGRAK